MSRKPITNAGTALASMLTGTSDFSHRGARGQPRAAPRAVPTMNARMIETSPSISVHGTEASMIEFTVRGYWLIE